MKFLLVDDEWQARDASLYTIRAIDSGATILEAATLAETFVVLEANPDVDLVLLDLNIGDSRGVSTLQRLSEWKEQHDCAARIVVISGEADVDLVRDVIENYATGFILKASPRQIFAHALALTIAGGVYLPEVLCRRLAPAPKPSAPSQGSAHERNSVSLTHREREIAALLVQGKTYKKIALDLEKKDGKAITDHTVRAHVSNIAWKLGVTENAKAGVIAEIARRGLRFPVS
jgi:DNA-binding NarL/FixJ family response regulator